MKVLYTFLLFLYPLVSLDTGDIIDKTADMLKNGNAAELSAIFAPNIQLTIMDNETMCSGTEAKTILANFFHQNPPHSVKILHRICSSAKFRFAVVMLTTGNGTFRTSFSLKNVQGRFELAELRIEPAKK